MTIRITMETIRSGQPRAYADSVHEEVITIEHKPWNNPNEFVPWDITSSGGKDLSTTNIPLVLSQYVPQLRLPTRDKAGMLQSYLSSFTRIGPGQYRAVSISPFTD